MDTKNPTHTRNQLNYSAWTKIYGMLVNCMKFLGSVKELTFVHCKNIITFEMVKRSSQERLKVVILRDLGLSWEKFERRCIYQTNQRLKQSIKTSWKIAV